MEYDIIEQKLINLNSANGTSNNTTFKSDITFMFPNVLKPDPDITHITIGVLNAQIPVSFYTINYTNDTIIIRFNSINYTVAITRGNYNSNSLIAELVKQFQLLGFNMEIQTSKINGIMTFTSTNLVPFSFIGTSSMFTILGFNPGTTYSSVSNQITAPYPLNLLGIKRLKINSGYLNTPALDSFNYATMSTIASIPVDVASFEMINFVNNSNTYPVSNATNITLIDIQILDENNNFINFNNIDWTMTLQINMYRKRVKGQNNAMDILNDIDLHIQNLLTAQQNDSSNSNDPPQPDEPQDEPQVVAPPNDDSTDNSQPTVLDSIDLQPLEDELDILQYNEYNV